MALTEKDYPRYMQRCLQLAQLGEYYVAPNPMVGAVLVADDGTIISEGWHEQYGGPHAEVNCFKNCPLSIINYQLCTLFVSLEPCSHYGKTPPCADLIISKGVKRVVVGCLDPNPQVAGRGIKKIQEAGIEVVTGILENECRQLNKRFICLQENKRPYVILKWAQTQDGVMGIAPSNSPIEGENAEQPRFVISNPLTKQIVHKMRAENMAILVGTNTALLDNPKLLTTHWSGRNPIRVLLDRKHRVPQTANIFSPDAETIVYSDNTDWSFILSDLAQRNIHSVLVEGGAQVLQHILDSGIYDELHIEVSPQRLGTPPAHLHYCYAPQVSALTAPVATIEGNQLFVIYNH